MARGLLPTIALTILIGSTVTQAWEDGCTPFKQAAAGADGIFRGRLTMTEESGVGLEVVEVLQGQDVPKRVLVPTGIWEIWGPKGLPPGDVTYLVLLRKGELLCGHINGLILLSHGCHGVLPVIEAAIPKEFAKQYDGESIQAVPLVKVRKDLLLIGKAKR